jgi:PAS domain S-box-containing protein
MSEPPSHETELQEARLEAVLESITDGFYALDSDWRFVIFNRAAETYFGASRDEVMGRNLWDVFPQGRGTEYERLCHVAMAERVACAIELPSRLRPDRVVEIRISPMQPDGIAVALTDVTERRLAQDALKSALARSEAILESISDGFYAVDAEWRFTYVNSVAEGWWGRPREVLLGRSIWEVFPEARESGSYGLHVRAAQSRQIVRGEILSPVLGRWIDLSIVPTETGLSVYFRDIEARKQADARQRLLVNELNHRVKNALATVQAIAMQSLRGEDVAPAARERFMARLMALARANDVLVAESWEGASLQAVAAQVAVPYGAGAGEGRFAISGPPVHLSPNTATALALALHELATNAAKYGALSRPDGRVELGWQAGEGGFRLVWRERDGPPVRPPTRTGFGSRLIQRGLAVELKGNVDLDYAPDGLVCTITAPLGEALSLA